jgi:hypothetical protein
MLEYYDFFIFGSAAALVFPLLFFPQGDPLVGTIAALATFGVGYVARPVGGLVLGHFGDRIGRKRVLIITLTVMGVASLSVGLLPTYAQVGTLAPAMLVLCRLAQGFSAGGEAAGASTLTLRIWSELQARVTGEDGYTLHPGRIFDKTVLPFRSFVCEPMRHGNLLLAGDAAHTVPPTGAKGLNLALADVRVLAEAIERAVLKKDDTALDEYGDRALTRVWKAQHFSYWLTSMLHNVDGASEFDVRRQLASSRPWCRRRTVRATWPRPTPAGRRLDRSTPRRRSVPSIGTAQPGSGENDGVMDPAALDTRPRPCPGQRRGHQVRVRAFGQSRGAVASRLRGRIDVTRRPQCSTVRRSRRAGAGGTAYTRSPNSLTAPSGARFSM